MPPPQPSDGKMWTVYIVECADTSLYTGITTNLRRRIAEHQSGKGAKYTKRRGPLLVRYTEQRRTRSTALAREAAIKALTRSAKLALIASSSDSSAPSPLPAANQASAARR